MQIEEIQRTTWKDPELQQIQRNLQSNQLQKLPKAYQPIAQELSVTDQDILHRGDRIVLPSSQRQQAINLAHEDHAGMVWCKQRLRSKLWWPEMDKQVEKRIRRCHSCQLVSNSPRSEPVKLTTLPQNHGPNLPSTYAVPSPHASKLLFLRTITLKKNS